MAYRSQNAIDRAVVEVLESRRLLSFALTASPHDAVAFDSAGIEMSLVNLREEYLAYLQNPAGEFDPSENFLTVRDGKVWISLSESGINADGIEAAMRSLGLEDLTHALGNIEGFLPIEKINELANVIENRYVWPIYSIETGSQTRITGNLASLYDWHQAWLTRNDGTPFQVSDGNFAGVGFRNYVVGEQVYIQADIADGYGPQARAALESIGLTRITQGQWNIEGLLPISAIPQLGEVAGVSEVSPAPYVASMGGRNVTWIDWKGQRIQVVEGEWLVGLERPEPTWNPDEEKWDSNTVWAGPDTPADPELLAQLEAMGLQFKGYLGTKHSFAIIAPADIDFAALEQQLSTLDQFVSVSPNSLIYLAGGGVDAPSISPGLPLGALPIIVRGDQSGQPTDDTILIRGNNDVVEVYINGVLQPSYAFVGISSITVDGLGGNDTITIEPGITVPITLNGGTGNDTIYGGSGGEVIIGFEGDDVIFGRGGADTIHGGAGNDSVFAGAGDDSVGGGGGNDSLVGGAGDELMRGGAGDDVLEGRAGNCTLYGGEGDDQLAGGYNALTTSAVGSLLFGQKGNDTLFGGDLDTLRGGGGDDLLFSGGDLWNDLLFGGTGNDRAVKDDFDQIPLDDIEIVEQWAS